MTSAVRQTQPAAPSGASDDNAIFYVPEGAFDRGLADVPAHLFADEQRCALAGDCPTGLIAMDLSATLGFAWPATTPAMLARYAIVRRGETLSHEFQATGEIYYVICGAGRTAATNGKAAPIEWRAGDVFCLPGTSATRHEATEHSVLLCVTNEPEISFARVRAPDVASNSAILPAFFCGKRIDQSLGVVHGREGPQKTAGKSVIFSTTPMASMKTILPSLTAAINSLEVGGDQRPHRHNAAALTLSIEGEGVHSMVGDQRIDWIPFGLMVTPPSALHSHHNRGPRMMKSFVIQDGALYYQLRNPGFSYEAAPAN